MITILVLIFVGVILGFAAAHMYRTGAFLVSYIISLTNLVIAVFTARLLMNVCSLKHNTLNSTQEFLSLGLFFLALLVCAVVVGIGWWLYSLADASTRP